MKESTWAALTGIHVLNKLAVSQEMCLDSEYSEKVAVCPCNCRAQIKYGDNSIGMN